MFSSRRSLTIDRMAIWVLAIFFCSAVQLWAGSGYLYVLNDGSDYLNPALAPTIMGFAVDDNSGTYVKLPGFPVSTNGTCDYGAGAERMALDPIAGRLYVVNGGSHSISVYAIDRSSGALVELPYSPFVLPAGTWASIVVHPSGSPVVVTDNVNAQIASLMVLPTSLQHAAGSPYALGSLNPNSSAFSPDGRYYYCGGDGSSTAFAGFSVNSLTGELKALPGSPFDSGNNAPGSFAMDSSGRLFLANHAVGQVRVFTFNDQGIPSAVTGNPYNTALVGTWRGIVHPKGFYIVTDIANSRIGVFKISGTGVNTTLTAVTDSSQMPFGANFAKPDPNDPMQNLAFFLPTCMATTQTGTKLFVSTVHGMSLLTYTINTNTGVLDDPFVGAYDLLGKAGGNISGMVYLPPTNFQTLDVKTAKISLNFAKTGKDSITFSGTIPIPENFISDGTTIFVDVGGVSRSYSLDAKGGSKEDMDAVKLTFKSVKGVTHAQTGKYSVTFKNGTYAPFLIDESLTNTNLTKVSRSVLFTISINQTVYQKLFYLSYTSKYMKTGVAN